MVHMLVELQAAVESIAGVVGSLDPPRLAASDATALLDTFTRAKRLCEAGEALCAARAVATSAHRREGQGDPARWLAARTGGSVASASAALSTAGTLESLPGLDAALRAGELSMARATEVASVGPADPAAADALVGLAKAGTLRQLKDHAAALRARAGSAQGESDAYMSIHRRRYLRHYAEPDGAFRLDARLCPDVGAALLAVIDAETAVVFEQARRESRGESRHAYAADALAKLVLTDTGQGQGTPAPGTGGLTRAGKPTRAAAQVSIRVDACALRRGYVQGDERCEIPGVGPVPVATARALLGDSVLRLVITEGVDVAGVCHLGRCIPAKVRTALEERDPSCVVPGCDVSHGLEIDHYVVAFADEGPSELWNLARICKAHHLLKTHRGYRLLGGPGAWRWLSPTEAGEPPPPQDTPGPGGPPSLFDTS